MSVVTDICHIYVAGKMKKALYLPCYLQGNTGLSRAAWAGEKTIRCFEFARASAR